MSADAAPCIFHRAFIFEKFLARLGIGGELSQSAVLHSAIFPLLHRCKEVPSAGAVVHVHLCLGVVLAGAQALLSLGESVEAEAIALAAHRLYAHHGTHRGIIQGAGIGNHLHISNLVAHKAFQLVGVVHPTAIYVVDRSATAYHFKSIALLDHSGHFAQHILCGSGFLKHRTAHLGHHCISFKSRVGELSLHHNFLKLHNAHYRVESNRVELCIITLSLGCHSTECQCSKKRESFHKNQLFIISVLLFNLMRAFLRVPHTYLTHAVAKKLH